MRDITKRSDSKRKPADEHKTQTRVKRARGSASPVSEAASSLKRKVKHTTTELYCSGCKQMYSSLSGKSKSCAGCREETCEEEEQNKRRQVTETKEQSHTVVAVFGAGITGAEVWLGVKIPSRVTENVPLQFLEKVESNDKHTPVLYELINSHKTYAPNMIEHTFENVVFTVVKTFQLTLQGGRQKKLPEINTRTKFPFDSSAMVKLKRKCRRL